MVRAVGVLVSVWCMLAAPAGDAAAALPPAGPHPAGQPIGWTAEPVARVVSATVYYRAVGARRYLSVPAAVEQGRVRVDLPASAAVPPGTEYYLEVRTADGRVVTDPPSHPRYNPYRLEVAASPAPVLAPAGSGPIAGGQPLVFRSGPVGGGTRYFLDGAEVTGAVEVRGDTVRYPPPADLEPGTHVFAAEDRAGRRVEVPVRVTGTPAGGPRGVLGLNGSLSFNYGYNARSRGGASGDRLSGNLNVEAYAEKGEFRVRFSGVNLQYDKDAPDPFTLSSGFRLEAAYGEQRLELGDVTVDETPLTVAGLSRRGAQLHLKVGRAEVRAFDVRTDTVDGWESGLFSSGRESQTYGVSVAGPLLADGHLDFHLTALSGRNESPSGAYDQSNGGPQEGDTVGVRVESAWGPVRLDGQYAYSRFDDDTSAGEGKKGDAAWEIRLTSDLGFGTLDLGYLRYGTDYATIAAPSFTGDRQGADGGFSTRIGPASWAVSGSFTEDNVGRDASKPIVRSVSGNTSLGWRGTRGVSMNLGYGIARQDSRDEPPGTTGVDNLNQQVSLNLAHAYGPWSGAVGGSLGFLDDRSAAGNDTDTRSVTLTTGLSGSAGSANLSLSFNQSITDAKTDRSRLASLTLAVPVWPEWVDLSGQVSYQLADASDGSVDTVTTGGSVRLAWNVDRLLAGADWVDVQLAVTGEYNRVDDRLDDANDSKEYLTFLTFNFGAPYRFGAETEW
ncbi:hypothetical protein [Deferrisoma camini]|uniref:hypothetical protein n=1 Tax=Deferrisoma camini TaxID=1035120 RepID=UPI00046CF566|nr:hypothetical protein [Deferrisoma camini]